jgi:hypothetical protein
VLLHVAVQFGYFSPCDDAQGSMHTLVLVAQAVCLLDRTYLHCNIHMNILTISMIQLVCHVTQLDF